MCIRDSFVNVGSWPSSFDALELEQAFLDGLRSWNAQGGAPVFLEYGGLTTSTQYGSGSDGSNTTFFEDSTWGSTLAISVRTVVGDAIRDCDIRFYGANSNGTIDWNIDPNGAPDGGHAVRHTLVHELGHCLGISHSELQDALMYAYAPADQGPGSWQLHPDDAGAVQAIYGVAQPNVVAAEWTVDEQQVVVALSNVGDWAAFDLLATLQVDGTEEVQDIGDVWPGEPLVLGFERGDWCGERDAVLQIDDALGASWESSSTLHMPCAVFDGPGEELGGCACSSAPRPGAWWLLGLLWMRRRR